MVRAVRVAGKVEPLFVETQKRAETAIDTGGVDLT
jgi:hypothetical protein